MLHRIRSGKELVLPEGYYVVYTKVNGKPYPVIMHADTEDDLATISKWVEDEIISDIKKLGVTDANLSIEVISFTVLLIKGNLDD